MDLEHSQSVVSADQGIAYCKKHATHLSHGKDTARPALPLNVAVDLCTTGPASISCACPGNLQEADTRCLAHHPGVPGEA